MFESIKIYGIRGTTRELITGFIIDLDALRLNNLLYIIKCYGNT